ncbi:hypothetical protein DVH29_11610 [Pelagibacterium lacus]|uniref:ParB-like N-terminal domain-containing protein n=1 Tax=Pelagibacterium lacus TaxID=2282655 RepID=A0A369W8I3_9HYPH|nr:hypothetical protein DVH29_11610 [Pelagibacterium lacus]
MIKSRQITIVPLADIVLDEGPRPIEPDAVSRLARSMSEIGMHTPVVVTFERFDTDERGRNDRLIYRVVTGRHRIAAARTLGWTEIETIRFEENGAIPEFGDIDVLTEMWALAENLHRAGLTKQQRDEQIRRYAELIELREHQSPQIDAIESQREDGKGHRPKGVASKVADETGLSKSTVERALNPERVAAEKERREAEKAQRQDERAEFDRQREANQENLPDHLKAYNARKVERIAARGATKADDAERIEFLLAENDELREANASLEAEVAAFKVDNAKWQEMKVQFERGGFEKVIADKDEEIRVLQTRLETESADKVSWMKSAKFWKTEAEKLGYGDDDVIPLAPRGGGNG